MLGLSAIRVTDPGTSPWSFDWLRREIAEPPSYLTAPARWLFGERNGIAVVVRPVTLPENEPYVAVVAEIDPPLHAGLRMFARSLVEPFRYDAVTPILGMPPIDRSFVLRTHDRDRAQRLFLRNGMNDDFAWVVGEAGQKNPLLIDDRMVSAFNMGAKPSELRIDEDLDLVTDLARRLAERGATLPERPDEKDGRESWSRAATTWSLVFDPARWKILGENEGRRIEVFLDGIPPAVSTIMRVSFRLPLGAGLFLRSGLRPKKKISASGHADLDEHLLFDARDRDKALAWLAEPATRAALAREALSANVTMTDRAVTSARGGFMRGRDVSARIEALVGIVDRITPPLQISPFR